jgi:hypothetical protein
MPSICIVASLSERDFVVDRITKNQGHRLLDDGKTLRELGVRLDEGHALGTQPFLMIVVVFRSENISIDMNYLREPRDFVLSSGGCGLAAPG